MHSSPALFSVYMCVCVYFLSNSNSYEFSVLHCLHLSASAHQSTHERFVSLIILHIRWNISSLCIGNKASHTGVESTSSTEWQNKPVNISSMYRISLYLFEIVVYICKSLTSLYIASVFIKLSLTSSSCSVRTMWNALHLFQVSDAGKQAGTYVWHISIVHSVFFL